MPVSQAEVEALFAEDDAAQAAGAAPPPASGGGVTEDEVRAVFEEDELDRDARVDLLFTHALKKQPDKHASILEIGRLTGVPWDVAEARFEEFRISAEASKFNPRAWRQSDMGRILEPILFNRPELAPTAMQDEELSFLKRMRRWTGADAMDGLTPEEQRIINSPGLDARPESRTPEQKAAFEKWKKLREQPLRKVETTIDPTAGETGLGRLKTYGAAFERSWKQNELADVGFSMLTAHLNGEPTWEWEKKAVDLQRELAPRSYGQEGAEQIIFDFAQLAPSIATSLGGAGAGGAIGAAAGGITGGLVTRSAAGAKQGAALGLKLGGVFGAAGTSFFMEAGSTFPDFALNEKTDDGRPMDRNIAAGATLAYAFGATAVETASFGLSLEAMGPLGSAIKAGSGKAFMASMMKDATAGQIFRRAGLASLKAKGAEAVEEIAQQAWSDFTAYMGRSATAGALQTPDVVASVERMAESGRAAFFGGLPGAAASTAFNVTTQVTAQRLQAGREERAGARAAEIAKVAKTSPTVRAAPEAVAQMIETAAKEGGEPATAMYVDPHAFVRLFQSENADPEAAAKELMGEEGPTKVREAIATGQKLEIPMAEYLEKWGPKPFAEALVPHTSTDPGLSPAEQEERRAEIEAEAQRIAKEAEAGQAPSEPEAKFAAELERQLATTGTYNEKEARTAIELQRAYIRTQATRFGMPADKLFSEFLVSAQREGQQATPQPLVPQVYTGASEALTKRLGAEMKAPEARAREFYIDAVTGLRNERAFDAMPTPAGKQVAVITSPTIKAINDAAEGGGHHVADAMLRAMAAEVFKLDPGAARSGTNLLLHVGDQAELDGLVRRLRELVKDPRVSVEGQLGPDRKTTGKALGDRIDEMRKTGKLPARTAGAKDIGLDVPALKFEGEVVAGQLPGELVQDIRDLSDEAYFKRAYVDEKTGLLSAAGWNAIPRKAHVAAFDLRGLKAINDRFGKEAGDEYLRQFGSLARDLLGADFDFAHLHGDEYAAQHDDLGALEGFIELLNEHAQNTYIPLGDAAGRIEFPLGFRHGIAERSYEAADADLNARKRREADASVQQRGGSVGVHGRAPGAGVQAAGNRDQRPGDLEARRAALQRRARSQGFASSPRAVDSGTGVAKTRLEQPAFHGTPHRGIERFSLQKIGTGEGNQTFGWGLYFANRKEVAESYRRTLTPREMRYDGDEIETSVGWDDDRPRASVLASVARQTEQDPSLDAEQALETIRDRQQKRIADLEKTLADLPVESRSRRAAHQRDLAEAQAILAATEDVDPSLFHRPKGQVYKVEVPEDEELLDYDKPLAKQPTALLQKLEALVPGIARIATPEGAKDLLLPERRPKLPNGEDIRVTTKGRVLYEALNEARGSPQAASEALQSVGIPGLRYLDQGSRAVGDGSQNYVIWDEERLAITDRFYQGERGYTDIFRDGFQRVFNIVLNEKADLSTFLHESAHTFLEMSAALAAREDAPAAVKEDFAQTLKWLGVEKFEDVKKEQHERWARAFEAYLLEGKAPAERLRRAFDRMRLWLKSVYRSIRDLNVELNPEIRGVFDRLLATDEEIQRAEQRMGLTPLFESPEQAGMSPDEWQSYLDEQERSRSRVSRSAELRALKDRLRETEVWWKQEEQRFRDDVAAEYEALPARKADLLLRGKRIDENGDEVAAQLIAEPIQLDREAVDAAVGPDAGKRFRRVKAGGIKPDEIAPAAGYPTGAAMLKAVVALPEKTGWVNDRAAQRMREKHPDVLEDREELRALVEKGLHGEHTARWLLREWAALQKKAYILATNPETGNTVAVPKEQIGLKPPPIESIKRAARLLVEKQRIERLEAGRYLQAERSAAEKAARAVAKEDFAQAYVFKQQQLLNHFMYRELAQAREDRDAFEELVRNLSDDKRRGQLGLAGREHLDTVDSILEAIAARTSEVDTERKSIDDLLRVMEAEGLVPAFDVAALKQLIAKPKLQRDLSVAEMRNTDAALRQVKKLAYDFNHVGAEERRIAVQELADGIADEAARWQSGPPIPHGETLKPRSYKVKMWFHGVHAAMRDPSALFRRLGPKATAFFWDGYIKARNQEHQLAKRVLAKFQEAWGALPETMQKERYALIDAEALPVPADTMLGGPRDRQWMWMVALNMGNASNRQRLLGGYSWSEEQVLQFLNQNMTKEEWGFVQGIWDLLDKELYPHVAEAFEKVNGIKPKKIEATPIETPHGQFAGGYFPARYQPIASRVGQQQAAAALEKLHRSGTARASVARSFTKERAKTYEDVILLDWGVMPGHVLEVIHYVAFDAFVRDANRVLVNPTVNKTIVERLGEPYLHTLTGDNGWIKAVANVGGDSAPKELRPLYAVLNWGKGRMVMRAMGWNIANALGDMTNPLFAVAAGKVSAKRMVAAYASSLGSLRQMRQDILELSPELQLREDAARSRLRREIEEVGATGKRTRVGQALERARETAFFFHETVQKLVDPIIWQAAFEDAKAAGLSEADAAAQADDKLRQSTPSKETAEKPLVLRDRRGIGQLVAFFGFFSRVFNTRADVIAQAQERWIEADTAGKAYAVSAAAGRMLAISFVASILGELAALKRGDDDDEEFARWAMLRALSELWAEIPVFGQVGDATTQALVRSLMGESAKPKFSSRLAPAAAGIQSLMDAMAKVATKDGDEGDKILDAIEALMVGGNLPSGAPIRAARYGEKVLTGERELPEEALPSAYDVLRGVTGAQRVERGE